MSDEAVIPAEILEAAPAPSGDGCKECEASGGWWFHLRRCVECGHVGCCDDSLSRHATAHFVATEHRYMHSFEPGDDWFWDFVDARLVTGGELLPPEHHPVDQTTPGPADRVPADWQQQVEAARAGRGE